MRNSFKILKENDIHPNFYTQLNIPWVLGLRKTILRHAQS